MPHEFFKLEILVLCISYMYYVRVLVYGLVESTSCKK